MPGTSSGSSEFPMLFTLHLRFALVAKPCSKHARVHVLQMAPFHCIPRQWYLPQHLHLRAAPASSVLNWLAHAICAAAKAALSCTHAPVKATTCIRKTTSGGLLCIRQKKSPNQVCTLQTMLNPTRPATAHLNYRQGSRTCSLKCSRCCVRKLEMAGTAHFC